MTKRSPGGPYFSCLLKSSGETAQAPEGRTVVARRVWLQPGPSLPLDLSQRARFRERFLPGYPLVWVEDSGSEILFPFWIPHDWFPLIAGLQAGGRPPPQLPADVTSALRRAGVLVDPAKEQEAAESRRATLAEARECFARFGYATVNGILHPAHLRALGTYYRRVIQGTSEIGDTQCERRYAIHNEGLARFFHYQFLRAVEQVAGQPIVPSYCYFAGYCEGAVLTRHTDRPQCAFSATLFIDYDPLEEGRSPWPLWLETRGAEIAVYQALGDLLVYRGTELPHWRTKLPEGSRSSSLLLHYVPHDFSDPLW